eukprot:6190121-Pleurochrysis_carterae.AAC.1
MPLLCTCTGSVLRPHAWGCTRSRPDVPACTEACCLAAASAATSHVRACPLCTSIRLPSYLTPASLTLAGAFKKHQSADKLCMYLNDINTHRAHGRISMAAAEKIGRLALAVQPG